MSGFVVGLAAGGEDEGAVAAPGFYEAVAFQFFVRSGDCVDGQPEVAGQLPHGRETGALGKFTGTDEYVDLVFHLFVRRFRRRRIHRDLHLAARRSTSGSHRSA